MTFEDMKLGILSCKDCMQKFGFEPMPIVQGNASSKIMQISQAPSNKAHITRKPFNDSSGKRLIHQWYKITDDTFYKEDNFYITALSHCFPGKNPKGGDKLPPLSCAKKWLHREMELVGNKLYIIIGRKAANFLFPGDNYKDLIFKDNFINEKPAIVLPHPSPLNIKWFRDHAEFETERLPAIREKIRLVLGDD